VKLDGGWQGMADCASMDPETYFPEQTPESYVARTVRSVCSGCRVRVKCLAFALETNCYDGIWAGFTAHERRELHPKVHAGADPWDVAVEALIEREEMVA